MIFAALALASILIWTLAMGAGRPVRRKIRVKVEDDHRRRR